MTAAAPRPLGRRFLVWTLGAIGFTVLWAVAAVAYILWLRAGGALPPLTHVSFEEIWMNHLRIPSALYVVAVVGTFLIGCATEFNQRDGERRVAAREARAAQQAADTQAAQDAAATTRHRFAAQVVGLQWLNPLQWRDYPTEWNALWTLGLAKPNADDGQVKEKPQKYATVQPVAGLAFNTRGKQTFDGYYEDYVRSILGKFWERYFMNKDYFYSAAKGLKPWREVAGIRVELALPGERLLRQESAAFMREQIGTYFGLNNPKLTTTGTPADVRTHAGGPAAGFASVEAALDYLEAHPEKTVWVAAFDAPSFPKDKQLDETGALLILAHPDYKTGREPLAWLHRASRVAVGPGHAAAAWKAALVDAAGRGALAPADLSYVIHDAGQGGDAASRRLGALAQGVTETLPDKRFLDHSFNTAALLGDLNAGTAATNLVLAIAYAHHKNVPVIVAGTHESVVPKASGAAKAGDVKADAPPAEPAVTAILVRPPAHPRPFDPAKSWFRARGEGNTYLPWWGRRPDADPRRAQGWSD